MIANSKLQIPADGDLSFEAGGSTVSFKNMPEGRFDQDGNQHVLFSTGTAVFKIDV
jgi:hypothetical protein